MNDDLKLAIGAAAHEIAAAANEIMRLSRPGSEGGDVTITDNQAIDGVAYAAEVIAQERLKVVDLAGQVRV